ncbi:response regulator [Candidatus Omnitrophota bacterium]
MSTPTILIVDDELEHRNTIRTYLSPRIECDIKEASNGNEAIQYLKSNPCDLIVLDIKMPVKGGVEVLDSLKDKEKKPDAIVITGWDSEQVYKQCRERGVTEYINKPISLELLLRSVKKILERRNQLKEKD